MAEALPNPDTLTRQPGAPSTGGDVPQTVEFDEPISPEEALAEAKAQKEAAERDRDAARAREQTLQRERDEALSRETQAGARAVSAQEQAIATAISSQTSAVNQAKTAYANARAAGDAMAEAEALDQLADARAALRELNGQKNWLEQQKTNPSPQTRQMQPDGVSVRTPGGTMVASPSAKEWMDENPRFYSDRAYYNHAVSAHGTLVADGIQEGTPAYFRGLTEQMKEYERYEAFQRGELKEPQVDTKPTPRQQPRISAASMGAPVSRAPATPSGGRNSAPDPNAIARRLGCEVSDLRDFARISGFKAENFKGDADAAFNAYLRSHQEIGELERTGGDTGLRVDGAWR